MKDRRIHGHALELIMRDVLEGMQEITRQTCASSKTGKLEIIAIEKNRDPKPDTARVIPFPCRSSRAASGQDT